MSDLLSQQLDQLAGDHFRVIQLMGDLLPAVDKYLETTDDQSVKRAREALSAYLHFYYGDFS